MWNTTQQENFNFYFQQLFDSIDQFFGGEIDWTVGYNCMKFWDFPDLSYFPKILILSRFANREATRIYHICYLYRRFVSFGVNGKFRKVSKILKIFCPWLFAKIYFTLYAFIKGSNCWKQSYFGCNLLYFSKTTSWKNLDRLPIPNLGLNEKIGKLVIK